MDIFLKEAYYLSSFGADDFVFFLDNVLWSAMYYWEAALFLIQKLKQLKPDIHIGLQSYKIKEDMAKGIFEQHEIIEYILRGEPERAFCDYVKTENKELIPGFVFRKNGKIIMNQEADVLKDLDTLPSPYQSGILNAYLDPPGYHFYFMTTSRGCPFRCLYCFRSVKFSRVRTFSIERVLDEIDYLANKKVLSVFMLDDCFVVSHERFFQMTEAYRLRFAKRKDLPEIKIMCRPEFLDVGVIQRLPMMKIRFVQLGLQSINPKTNNLMGRGIDMKKFKQIVCLLKRENIKVHLDVIIGLPGDNMDTCKKTLDFAIKLRPFSLQVKQLYQNPNTAFDMDPHKYGIKVENKKQMFHVPLVTETNTFSNSDIRLVSGYASILRNKHPEIKMKILTQFHRIDDFG